MSRTRQARIAIVATMVFPLAALATFATGHPISGALFLIAAGFATVTAYTNTRHPQ